MFWKMSNRQEVEHCSTEGGGGGKASAKYKEFGHHGDGTVSLLQPLMQLISAGCHGNGRNLIKCIIQPNIPGLPLRRAVRSLPATTADVAPPPVLLQDRFPGLSLA